MALRFEKCLAVANALIPRKGDFPEGRDVIVFLAAEAVEAITMTRIERQQRFGSPPPSFIQNTERSEK